MAAHMNDRSQTANVLGISAPGHHSTAALLQDGLITAAIEDQKLLRVDSSYLPEAAMHFCLEHAGVEWKDLDAVSIATRPIGGWIRRSWNRTKLLPRAPLASVYHLANELSTLAKGLKDLRRLRAEYGRAGEWQYFDHHLCHAAAAFYQSPFDRALIFILDENGDGYSGAVALGTETGIRVLRRIEFPNSLAWVYSRVTELIGFTSHRDEHKTQWLGLEGEPLYKQVFLEMLRDQHAPFLRLNRKYVDRSLAQRLDFSERFFAETRLPKNVSLDEYQRRCLARSIQEAFVELITDLAEFFRRRLEVKRVCFAGGLFQNSVLVASLERSLGPADVFVPPAPGNAGTAVGAAFLGWHRNHTRPRVGATVNAFGGPNFTNQEVKDVLDNCKSRYSIQATEDRKLDATVQLLRKGKIVGWFQGQCEFGPRALGNRSVLASPWASYVKENLNDYIKFREWFRPFAISVPEEDCARYFECSRSCRYMNSMGWVQPGVTCVPPAFILPGGRVRLHIVEQSVNPLFWKLLKRFGEQAPAPMLVNTSFNLFGEPLIAAPRDAVRSYFCSGLDGLVINNFLLCKDGSAFTKRDAQISKQVQLQAQ